MQPHQQQMQAISSIMPEQTRQFMNQPQSGVPPHMLPPNYPPNRVPPESLPMEQGSPQFSNPADIIKSSIQPASGTGQFGCSLDVAFMPSEEPDMVQPASSDQRYAEAGKVNQRDIDMYTRLREQSGKISNGLSQT
jgi:hypothetical protein